MAGLSLCQGAMSKKSQHSHQQHIPLRTCIACKQVSDKGKLIRLVRVSTAEVKIDETGKQPGRGAYLCAFRGCWEAGAKSHRLEYALRGKIEEGSRKRLLEYGQTLPVRL